MNRDELLKTKEYWVAQFQTKLFETLEDFLATNAITQTEFAERLGVSKGYVSQILNGDFDHKISKFVELLLACNKVPIISIADLNEVLSTNGPTNDSVEVAKKQHVSPNVKSAGKVRA